MDAVESKEPKRPPAAHVQELMRLYPMLDQLMCELVLSCTEEELAEILAQPQEKETKSEEINVSN